MHNDTQSTDILTVSQVAEALGVTSRTILRRIARGEYTAAKLPGRTGPWLLDPAVLDEQETS